MCRDVSKTFKTKQYFAGANKHFIRFPALHRFAIYWGLYTERISQLAEDHLRYQLFNLPVPEMETDAMYQLMIHSKYVAHHNDDTAY